MKCFLLSALIAGVVVSGGWAQETTSDDSLVVYYSGSKVKDVVIQSAEVKLTLRVPAGTLLQVVERGAHSEADYARIGQLPHVYRGEITVSTLPGAQVQFGEVLEQAFEQPTSRLVLHDATVTVKTSALKSGAESLRVGKK